MTLATLTDELNQLQDAQLVRLAPDEEQAYFFKHALTHEVAYESLLVSKRRGLHRLVGQAYEQTFPNNLDEFASLLAHHYRLAADDEKTVEYAIRAGDHARHLSAEAEAATYYASALESLSRLPRTIENRRTRIDTLLKHLGVSFSSTSPEQNLAILQAVEPEAKELDDTQADPADHRRNVWVKAWIARMHFFLQQRRPALEAFRELLSDAEEMGDEELRALALTMIARTHFWEGDFVRARPVEQQVLAVLEERESWTEWILSSSFSGVAAVALGDYRGGIDQVQRALERAQDLHHQVGIAIAYSLLAIGHLLGGSAEEALRSTRAVLKVGENAKTAIYVYNAWGIRAWAESRLGQHEAAIESMEEAEAVGRRLGPRLFFEDWYAAARVEMALNAGKIQETVGLAKESLAVIGSLDGKFAEGIVQRAWGQALNAVGLAHAEEAESHLAASLELFSSGGAVLEMARTHIAWGRVLIAKNDAAAARHHLEEAAAQFGVSGLDDELEEAKRLLASPSL